MSIKKLRKFQTPPIGESYRIKNRDIKIKHVSCNGMAQPDDNHDYDKFGTEVSINGEPIVYDDFKKFYCSFERNSILHS